MPLALFGEPNPAGIMVTEALHLDEPCSLQALDDVVGRTFQRGRPRFSPFPLEE